MGVAFVTIVVVLGCACFLFDNTFPIFAPFGCTIVVFFTPFVYSTFVHRLLQAACVLLPYLNVTSTALTLLVRVAKCRLLITIIVVLCCARFALGFAQVILAIFRCTLVVFVAKLSICTVAFRVWLAAPILLKWFDIAVAAFARRTAVASTFLPRALTLVLFQAVLLLWNTALSLLGVWNVVAFFGTTKGRFRVTVLVGMTTCTVEICLLTRDAFPCTENSRRFADGKFLQTTFDSLSVVVAVKRAGAHLFGERLYFRFHIPCASRFTLATNFCQCVLALLRACSPTSHPSGDL